MPFPSGASFIDIDVNQLDKKSPVDDDLMDSIGEDLYYLKNNLGGGGSGGVLEWKVNGALKVLRRRLPFRRIDGGYVSAATTLSRVRMFLENPGRSGTLEIDVRKYRTPQTYLTAIDYQYQAAIQSINRAGSAGSTQSITLATPQINTQTITFWKSQLSVNSIIYLGAGLWRYNLAGTPDSDWKIGDYIVAASCTNAGNNGNFQIVRVNDDGYPSIVVRNGSGVAQTSAAGNVNLLAFSYNFTNPVNTAFVAGEKATFASHTNAGNDGTFVLEAVNQAGNNLIVKNPSGQTQGSAAGTADCLRFVYTLAASVSTDIIVGETANFSSHTSSVNDGNIEVKIVSGSTITVYNPFGVVQGGIAGSVNSNRWIYALPNDPSTDFSVGHNFYASGVSNTANSGVFAVVQVKRSALDNLVVFNESGVTQGGVAGTLTHTRRILRFDADYSNIYAADVSRIALTNTPEKLYLQDEWTVVEVNRGGGANYNVVIEEPTGKSVSQASPAGRIIWESRSVFSTRPTITSTEYIQYTTNGVLDNTEKVIAADRMLCMEFLQLPSGSPSGFTVHVS